MPDKGERLFVLEKGTLSQYGYENVINLSQIDCRKSLMRSLQDIKPLSLFRKLNALYVLNQNKDPEIAELFKNDRDWVKTTEQ